MIRSPLKRGAPLVRKTPIKRSNPKRRAAKYVRNFSGPGDFHHDTWIRAKRCCLCATMLKRGQHDPTEAAHTKARGMGGANGSYKDLVPLCRTHHRSQESLGNRWALRTYGVDLVKLAATLLAEHEAEAGKAAA
ncbi:MAG TPA: hypothetical protein VHO25_24075 [Polyangiaceae bacterium]|nr:hypothetical protein [Polyangiaceae bacterium]